MSSRNMSLLPRATLYSDSEQVMPQFQQHYNFVAVLPDDKYDVQLFTKICCNVFQLPIQYPPRTYWSTTE